MQTSSELQGSVDRLNGRGGREEREEREEERVEEGKEGWIAREMGLLDGTLEMVQIAMKD